MEKKTNTNPIAVQSKRWIMEALLMLLEHKPYSKITVTEIADKAQLGRRTFYRNFDTKEDVLDMYIQKLIFEYVSLLKETEQLTIYKAARVYFSFWHKHVDFLMLMDKNNILYILLQKYNKYLPMIHKEIFKDRKEIYEGSMQEYIFMFSAGGFWNMLIKWIEDGAEKTPDEMAKLVAVIINEKLL